MITHDITHTRTEQHKKHKTTTHSKQDIHITAPTQAQSHNNHHIRTNQCCICTQDLARGGGSLSRNAWECSSFSRNCVAVRLELCTSSEDVIDDPEGVHAALDNVAHLDLLMQDLLTSLSTPLTTNNDAKNGVKHSCMKVSAKNLENALGIDNESEQDAEEQQSSMPTACTSSCRTS